MRRVLFSLLVVGVVFALAYGAAASITVSGSNVGSGTGTVSGYSVSGVVWTLNSTDPTLVDSVSFSINPAAHHAYARALDSNGNPVGNWATCSGSGAAQAPFPNWNCTFPSPKPTAANVANLQVAAD